MNTNLSRYKADLDKLIALADKIEMDLSLCHLERQDQLKDEDKENATHLGVVCRAARNSSKCAFAKAG